MDSLRGLVGGLVLLYAALMSSHVAAFRILYGLRVRLSEHIGKLPLGYLNNTSTGAIKKTMDQNIEKDRRLHRPYHPGFGQCCGNGGGDTGHLFLFGCMADSGLSGGRGD